LGDGVVVYRKTLRGLPLAAALWLLASAATAAPQPGPDMPLGPASLAPAGYVAFCERKPQDCGAEAAVVLADARRVDADRRQLLAQLGPSPLRTAAPAALPASFRAPAPALHLMSLPAPVFAAPEPQVAGVERADLATTALFVDPVAARLAEQEARAPRMTPWLWSTLNRVNGEVNGRIEQRTDAQTYGRDDYWNTPLEDGGRAGDCEDFALEKQRALIAAGVPRAALNLAIVVTRWGETHAVLLVSTGEGEYVLDSLSPWVVGWRDAPYLWVRRQVDGEPFRWVMAAPAVNERHPAARRLLIAFRR
jgi:predicted transglutaminase-like cysteine proteinase